MSDLESLFEMFREAAELRGENFAEMRKSFAEWKQEAGDDFWFQQCGSALIVAMKFDDPNEGIHAWFAPQSVFAQFVGRTNTNHLQTVT